DVARPYEHRVADPLGDLDGLVRGRRRPPGRHRDPEAVAERRETLAVLGQVDGFERRPEHPEARRLDRARQLERGLAAELDHDAGRLLALADRQDLLHAERLEVEAVGGVVVGRDGLWVAVDHHGLVTERAEALRGVHAAVVELDPLADPVRAGTQDHDRAAARRQLVRLAPGRVEVVRGRLDLAGAGVDPPVARPDAPRPPRGAGRLLVDARRACDIGVRVAEPLEPQP